MAEVPVNLIVAVYPDESSAESTLDQMQQAKRESLSTVHGAVALSKGLDGNLRTKDVGLTPGKGLAAGAALGAVVGILTGGIGLVAGALGGVIGGVLGARKRDARVNTDSLNEIAVGLAPGSSALVLAVEPPAVEQLARELTESGAKVRSAVVAVDVPEKSD